jgi:flavin-dependent dehydrogenase
VIVAGAGIGGLTAALALVRNGFTSFQVAIEAEKLVMKLRRSKTQSCERYLRDAYTWIAAQGTNDVQKLIISREILNP